MDFGLRRSTRTRKSAVLDFQDAVPTKKRSLFKCKKDGKELQDEHQQQDHHVFTLPQGNSEERKPEEEPHKEEDHQFLKLPPAKSKGNQQLQPEEGEPQQDDHHLVTPAKLKEHQQFQEEEEEPQEEIDHHSVTLPLEKSEEHKEEEYRSVTLPPVVLGHVAEAEVAGTGGVEVIPIDICSSPEETKPGADPLSLLQPVSKPNYQVKLPRESLKQIMDVAVVFKSALVSHIENLAHSLDIATMVQSANECFNRIKALEVDYQTFHIQISRLIKYYQKLKEATEGKNLELEAAYEVSVIDADDAKNELHRVENDLLNAQANNKVTRERIKELKESLAQLKAQDVVERNRLVTLTDERNRCHEAHSCFIRKVDRLYSELEGYMKRDDAIREEIQRLLSSLKGP